MKVAVFIGSESDLDVARGAIDVLKGFGIPFALEVTSAHRSPERTVHLVQEMEKKGCQVFIAMAGKAAHLAGVVASKTLKPVIGVPVGGATLTGLDALLSTVQMPQGVPVACMGIGQPGAVNAALLAVRILSLDDGELRDKLVDERNRMAVQVEESSRKVKESL